MKIKLVEDWKDAWRWSEVRIMLVLSGLMAATPELAHLAAELSDNWPVLSPYLQTLFPQEPQTFWPAAGTFLGIIARVLEVSHKDNG
jgi:hypothetical protein